MTKSELKDIIKECIDELNYESIEESVDINSVNEDSRIIDEAEYMDFMYNSILVETVAGEYDTFNDICKSVVDESFNIVNESVVQKIKDLIDKFIRWIKEKVIPFFKNIIPNILNKNIDRVKELAKAGKLKDYSFTDDDINTLKTKFPVSEGKFATVKASLVADNANADFRTMNKIITDIENGNSNNIDAQLDILKQNSLFSDDEINSKSIKSDFMDKLADKVIAIFAINAGDKIDQALNKILHYIENLKTISLSIGKNADTFTKKINILKSKENNMDSDIKRVLSSCTRVINSYTDFMSCIVKENTRYVNAICVIYDKHSKSDKDDK